ncbi:MAG: O-antigen ligase family protein, partial [Bdellovibrionota bacterium]
YWPKALGAAHLLFAIPTLLFCQSRAAIILTLINMGVVVVCPHGSMKKRVAFVAVFSLVAGIAIAVINSDAFGDAAPGASTGLIGKSQVKLLRERALTLLDQDVMARARGGAFDASLSLAERTPFGIGLSRVGAASAVWRNRIVADKYFNVRWSFADNLYRAVFTELGIFGLIFWLLLTVSISMFHIRNSFRKTYKSSAALLWLCGAYPIVALIGGMGSEGILYNPTSGFFWLLLAIGLKEVSSDPAQV